MPTGTTGHKCEIRFGQDLIRQTNLYTPRGVTTVAGELLDAEAETTEFSKRRSAEVESRCPSNYPVQPIGGHDVIASMAPVK
ncbi:hypothetical protein LOC67_12205 [Stieleria sp. JC731]|uniref:hypothetical protein n=1 Tax=Pirellulaceae TaxID=2691357 RepID=UPI001E5FAD26|nr:hypothetical protein [Stieleria sp. JC731]MCC9601310.1 hypothetical protein [Stieleria sp. JC731]